MIFKFKLPPKPILKIDLQEWNDMQVLMEKLQKQSQEIPQVCISGSAYKWQAEQLFGRYRGTGIGTI